MHAYNGNVSLNSVWLGIAPLSDTVTSFCLWDNAAASGGCIVVLSWVCTIACGPSVGMVCILTGVPVPCGTIVMGESSVVTWEFMVTSFCLWDNALASGGCIVVLSWVCTIACGLSVGMACIRTGAPVTCGTIVMGESSVVTWELLPWELTLLDAWCVPDTVTNAGRREQRPKMNKGSK